MEKIWVEYEGRRYECTTIKLALGSLDSSQFILKEEDGWEDEKGTRYASMTEATNAIAPIGKGNWIVCGVRVHYKEHDVDVYVLSQHEVKVCLDSGDHDIELFFMLEEDANLAIFIEESLELADRYIFRGFVKKRAEAKQDASPVT